MPGSFLDHGNVRPFRAAAGGQGAAARRNSAVSTAPADSSVAPDLRSLLARSAAGEQEAFSQLYDATSSAVFGVALRILSDRAEAEEVALDVFLQVWRDAARYDPARGSALSWILIVTRSRAIDRFRARRPSRRAETPLETHEVADEAPGPAECSWVAQQGAIVRRALAELPSDQRRALELAYFGGLTHVEIAERLSVPIGTAKTRIRLAMSKLRETLAPMRSMENVS